ncbi:hypothetical protein LTR81_026712 [Elasticomyces elasticus]
MPLVDTASGNGRIYDYAGPSQPVQNIASAVLALGQILSIAPPASTTSWTLDFWGPALQCQDVEGAERDTVWVNVWNSYENVTNTWPFLSWVPETDLSRYDSRDIHMPFAAESSEPALSSSTLNYHSGMTLYMAVLPGMLDMVLNISKPRGFRLKNITSCQYTAVSKFLQLEDSVDCGDKRASPSVIFEQASLLKCSMVNTSYSATFTYTNGVQNIKVLRNTTAYSTPVTAAEDVFGNEYEMGAPCDYTPLPSQSRILAPCLIGSVLLQRLSYQSIFSAFVQLVRGTIYPTIWNGVLNINTTLLTPVLAQTKELTTIRSWKVSTNSNKSVYLQSALQHMNGTASRGLANDLPRGTRGSLKAALEQAFENVTISMLADLYLQPNASSQFAPSLTTDVTTESIVNFYVYDRNTPWIAYGLAILFSTLAVVAGLVFLAMSGASYDTTFSTIVRVWPGRQN